MLPPGLIASLKNAPGFDEPAFEAVHELGPAITSIRQNPSRPHQLNPGWITEKIPWSSNGFYLQTRPSFTADPLFHAGAYYVQEASSMFLEEVMKQTVPLTGPLRVLDLCAAPGGKSTLIQSLISKDSLLVSNDVIKTRVNILSQNISKWGAANVIVTNNDPRDFQRLPGYFDVIIADAPCSGSGLFRKDPEAVTGWSESNVMLCSERQQRILADVMPSLKEDGVLIYSTCSYSVAEDESILQWLVDGFSMEGLPVQINPEWNIVETKTVDEKAVGYRFYPDRLKGEGFFIAALKKTQPAGDKIPVRKDQKIGKLPAKETAVLQTYLEDSSGLFFIKQQDEILSVPAAFERDLTLLKSNLYLKKAGVKMGTIIRDELIPDHEFALSLLRSNSIPRIEVDLHNALQYLRKETIDIAAGARGWALLTYQEIPLGWIKILPGRINNYYPSAWRILNK